MNNIILQQKRTKRNDGKYKTKIITKDNFCKTCFLNSIILKYEIKNENGKIISKNKINLKENPKDKIFYRRILIDIWKTKSTDELIKQYPKKFKITDEGGNKGYYWSDDLQLSVQGKNANNSIKDIYEFCEKNKYKIGLFIKLNDNKKVYLHNIVAEPNQKSNPIHGGGGLYIGVVSRWLCLSALMYLLYII